MKKTYSIEVDCANCANLMEEATKKTAGVANAIIAAEISLSGIHQLIPFDEMLNAMYIVGKRLPAELRETAQGGCAATPSACAACRGCA